MAPGDAWREAGIIVERDVPVPMRDGVILRANVYRPADGRPAPVLLLRLPYDKEIAQAYVYAHPAWYVRRGYGVVTQDTRGRGASEGDFYPLRHDDTDGYDTIEWCASLPWSNGRVGTYGFSHPGITQLLAAAERPPHLVATAPAFCPSGLYDGWCYVGGAFALACMAHWAVLLGGDVARRTRDRAAATAVREADRLVGRWYPSLSLRDLPLFGDPSPLPFLADYLRHPSHDAYWRQ